MRNPEFVCAGELCVPNGADLQRALQAVSAGTAPPNSISQPSSDKALDTWARWTPVKVYLHETSNPAVTCLVFRDPGGVAQLVLPTANVTWLYAPPSAADGDGIDRHVHAAATPDVAERCVALRAVEFSPHLREGLTRRGGHPNVGFLTVEFGIDSVSEVTVVDHLRFYVPDAPVLLRALDGPAAMAAHAALFKVCSAVHDPWRPCAMPTALGGEFRAPLAPATERPGPGIFRTFLRTLVSKSKKRYVDDGYNLDLAFVAPGVIAMGYPTPSYEQEATYRNDMADAYDMFIARYESTRRGPGPLFWVLNLCSERCYPPSAFNGCFTRLPFDDHNPPPLRLLLDSCTAIAAFFAHGKPIVVPERSRATGRATFTSVAGLSQTEEAAFWVRQPPFHGSDMASPATNAGRLERKKTSLEKVGGVDAIEGTDGRVLAVHCKAGKGRTGVLITAWMFYSRWRRLKQRDSEPPLDCVKEIEACARDYGKHRSSSGAGVTIPSQARFLRYFARCCAECDFQLPAARPVALRAAEVKMLPALDDLGGCRPFLLIRTFRPGNAWASLGRRELAARAGAAFARADSLAVGAATRGCPDEEITMITLYDSRVDSVSDGASGMWQAAGTAASFSFGGGGLTVSDEFHVSLWHDCGADAAPKPGVDEVLVEMQPPGTHGRAAEMPKKTAVPMGAAWLHTSFLDGRALQLPRASLDGCSKAPLTQYDDMFQLTLEFDPCPPTEAVDQDLWAAPGSVMDL